MKKKILSGRFASALLIVAAIGAMESKKSVTGLNELALANVEALAQDENGSDYCDKYCRDASEWTCTVYVNGVPMLPCHGYRAKSQ